jgi:plastocyanin
MARIALSVVVVLVAAFGMLPGVSDVSTAAADRGGHGASMRGCGSGQQSVAAGAISELPRVTVGIYDGFFLPAEITVAPGTIVVWRNMGDQPHTTTAWNRWDSGVLRHGESCMAWFVTPGSYDYLSIVAADGGTMMGNVTVDGPPIGSGMGSGMMGHRPGDGHGHGMGMMPGMGTMPMMPGMGPMGPGY